MFVDQRSQAQFCLTYPLRIEGEAGTKPNICRRILVGLSRIQLLYWILVENETCILLINIYVRLENSIILDHSLVSATIRETLKERTWQYSGISGYNKCYRICFRRSQNAFLALGTVKPVIYISSVLI